MERRIVAQMLTCMDDLQMPAGIPERHAGGLNGDQEDAKQSAAQQAKHVVIIGEIHGLPQKDAVIV